MVGLGGCESSLALANLRLTFVARGITAAMGSQISRAFANLRRCGLFPAGPQPSGHIRLAFMGLGCLASPVCDLTCILSRTPVTARANSWDNGTTTRRLAKRLYEFGILGVRVQV